LREGEGHSLEKERDIVWRRREAQSGEEDGHKREKERDTVRRSRET